MSYWYVGVEKVVLRKFLKRAGILVATATVSLVVATAGGSGHVAVWMGVSTPDAQNWLQAGIERTAGDTTPSEYIEIGRHGQQVSLRLWPTTLGHKAHIVLYKRGSYWKIMIDSHTSKWVYIPGAHPNTLKLLEFYKDGGTVHGVATIDGHRVHG